MFSNHSPAEPTGRSGLSRRRLIGATAGAAITFGVAARQPLAAAAPPWARSTTTDLGVPMRERNIRAGAIGRLRGRTVVHAYSNGAVGVFSTVDASTGELLSSHEIGEFNSFDMTIAPDESVYISTHIGGLFHYLPDTDEVRSLGLPGSQTHAFGTAVDSHGTVYGGTYPDGHLYRYDPVADAFHDYGQLAASEGYVKSVAFDEESGTIYAGTRPNGLLFAVDAESGATTPVPLPTGVGDPNNILYLRFRAGLLFVQTAPGLAWSVYDPTTRSWLATEPDNSEGAMSEVLDGRTYFARHHSGMPYQYDIATNTFSATEWSGPRLGYDDTRAIGIGPVAGDDYPGSSVIGLGLDGRLWHYNPQTTASRFVTSQALGSPIALHAVSPGPDRMVYVGGYLTSGTMAKVDPANGAATSLRGPRQIEGSHWHDGLFYLSAYPQGALQRFDPTTPDRAPQTLFDLGEGQDRAFALTTFGTTLAVGTIADSRAGFTTGQLITYDLSSGALSRKGGPVEGHGIAALLHHDGLLVGATSMHHLAADHPDPSAKLFLWDLAADRVVWSGSPVPEVEGIGAITFDDRGNLWGLASDGTLFVFDLDSRRVTRTYRAVVQDTAPWGIPKLFPAPNGYLYGSTGGTYRDGLVFSVHPRSGRTSVLDSGNSAALTVDGAIAFARGSHLLRMDIPGPSGRHRIGG